MTIVIETMRRISLFKKFYVDELHVLLSRINCNEVSEAMKKSRVKL